MEQHTKLVATVQYKGFVAKYYMFKVWLESSLRHLYDSAVEAFPHTTKRQHVTGTININEIRITPYLGMRTLFIRSSAFNEENGNSYNPVILFKQVNFNPQENIVQFIAGDNNQQYQIERLSTNNQNVLVRCECKDFHYRFHHYNYLDRSLWGKNRKPYHGQGLWQANPMELEGICKHIMKMFQTLEENNFLN